MAIVQIGLGYGISGLTLNNCVHIRQDNLNQLGKIDKAEHEKAEREFSEAMKKQGGVCIPRPIMAEFLTEKFLRPHFIFLYSLEGLVDQMFEL